MKIICWVTLDKSFGWFLSLFSKIYSKFYILSSYMLFAIFTLFSFLRFLSFNIFFCSFFICFCFSDRNYAGRPIYYFFLTQKIYLKAGQVIRLGYGRVSKPKHHLPRIALIFFFFMLIVISSQSLSNWSFSPFPSEKSAIVEYVLILLYSILQVFSCLKLFCSYENF